MKKTTRKFPTRFGFLLLDGYRCSIHWENMAALTDLFPNVAVSRNVFTIDRNRYTSSGGTTPVDMMLHFVRAKCGAAVSAGVAEQFIYERIRRSDDEQRVPLKHVMGHQPVLCPARTLARDTKNTAGTRQAASASMKLWPVRRRSRRLEQSLDLFVLIDADIF